jgi:hypothetical protein
MKITLTKTPDPNNTDDTVSVEMSFGTDDVSEMIVNYEMFMRACGYCPRGSLEFVNDEGVVSE